MVFIIVLQDTIGGCGGGGVGVGVCGGGVILNTIPKVPTRFFAGTPQSLLNKPPSSNSNAISEPQNMVAIVSGLISSIQFCLLLLFYICLHCQFYSMDGFTTKFFVDDIFYVSNDVSRSCFCLEQALQY